MALLAACSSASAQLPQVDVQLPQVNLQLPQVKTPLPDGAVGDVLPGKTVEKALTDPLPGPVEDVVEASPVAPIREEVRRLTGSQPAGGGSPNPGAAASPSGSNPAQPGSGQPSPGTGTPAEETGGGPRGRDSDGTRPRGADRGGTGSGDTVRPSAAGGAGRAGARQHSERSRRAAPDEGGSNGVVRSIENVVGVIPTFVWIALGLLALVALALGGRAFVERRRFKRVERERLALLDTVGVLERALLPPIPPLLGGLEASVAYRPSEGPGAGGDFYDAFELADGRAAVLVGDVCGHGPEALEQTNSIRLGLRGCLEGGLTPRRALEAVARTAPLPDGAYATVVVAVHDPVEGTLSYASAGHPPPIVAGPSEHEPVTAAASPPVGLGFRTGLRQTTVAFPTGSTACMFTDGVLEARVGEALLGREGLVALVTAAGPAEPAEQLLDRIVAEVDETPDDMAVCLLRPAVPTVCESSRVEELELDAEDDASGLAARFLEACGIDEETALAAVEEIDATVAASGDALLVVTIEGASRRVGVTAVRDEARRAVA